MSRVFENPFEMAARYEQGKAVSAMGRVVRGWEITPHERRDMLSGLSKYPEALSERFGVSVATVVELADNLSDPADGLFGFMLDGGDAE